MKQPATTRRKFLQSAAAGAAATMLEGPSIVSAGVLGSVKIEEPFHGAVLNQRHGRQVNGGLRIRVSGQAPLRDRVTVNGSPAQRAGTRFMAPPICSRDISRIDSTKSSSVGRV